MGTRPRKATEQSRQQIISALKNPKRRFLDLNGSSRNFLDKWGLKAEVLYQDLADGLAISDCLFLKPKTFPQQSQRYQCVLVYEEDLPEYPTIEIHITIAPSGDNEILKVKISLHPSDTDQALPRISA